MTAAHDSIPTDWYLDPEVLRIERELVFRPHWHYVGTAEDVREPGSYAAVLLGDLPVVVTRDMEGVLRALANVCRHRGSVIAEGCGRRKTLQCVYHGWTYDLDGALRRSPGVEVDPEQGQLPVLSVGTVGDLLFVSAVPAAPPIASILEPWVKLTREVSGVDLGSMRRARSIPHRIAANWKVVAENFLECYHCPLIHGDTLPGYGDDDYIVVEHGAIETHRLDRDRFSWTSLFPNTQISCFGDHGVVVARQLVPDGTGETIATLDYWFEPDRTEEQIEETIAWFEKIVGEDIPLCESVQVGLRSGFLERGVLHPEQERGPLAFQERVLACLAGTLA